MVFGAKVGARIFAPGIFLWVTRRGWVEKEVLEGILRRIGNAVGIRCFTSAVSIIQKEIFLGRRLPGNGRLSNN